MKISVKETVREAAQVLGISECVESYLSGEDSEIGQKDTELLVDCFNRVQNELALDYLPLTAEDEFVTATGIISYAHLTNAVTRILCVENGSGESIAFKLFADRLEAQPGKVKVYYAYAPADRDINGFCEYETDVSKRLFVYGMAAEYALIAGENEAASVWDKKYKEAVNAAYKIRPGKKLRSRRWV